MMLSRLALISESRCSSISCRMALKPSASDNSAAAAPPLCPIMPSNSFLKAAMSKGLIR